MILLPRSDNQSQQGDSLASYTIVQHVPDPFRQETRNVGVVVTKNGRLSARFLGERDTALGSIDGRKLRGRVHSVSLYKMWVRHWRKSISRGEWPGEACDTHGPFYRIIPAGEVSDTGYDSPDTICDFLYSLLVSEGGVANALKESEVGDVETSAPLRVELHDEFKRRGLLKEHGFVRRPIMIDQSLNGRIASEHYISFFHRGTRFAHAMEPLDLRNSSREKLARGRVLQVARLFQDVGGVQIGGSDGPSLEAYALVRHASTQSSTASSLRKYADELLGTVAHSHIVDLEDDEQRDSFFEMVESNATDL